MAHYRGTIATPKPAPEVFDYMADFRSVREWDETVTSAELLGSTPPGPGARFRVKVKLMGRENVFDYETTAYDPPRMLVLRAESASVITEDTVTVRESAEGSELTYDADLRPKGWMKLVDPLLNLVFQRLGKNAARGLARELGGRVV